MSVGTSFCSVAILAGGKGTRLKERSGNMPKPMMPILGKPLLQHQIELCKRNGFTRIALLVEYQHEKISEYFGDGAAFGVNLQYAIESDPRGTSGALRDALPYLADRFMVLYGDTFLDVDLRRMWTSHSSSGAAATLFLHPNDHPQDSDLVDIDAIGNVKAIFSYPHPPEREVRNLVNAALYIFEKSGLEDVTPLEGKADIAKHMFPQMLALGRNLRAYITPEYIKDMGTPERLDKVERDFSVGLPENLSSRNLRSAVFLDRDGTLIKEVGHLNSPDQLELLPNVGAAIRSLNRNGKLAILATNQPVIARGDLSFEGLAQIHARLESHLGKDGAYFDALYFCPHHPDKGFPGEILELKVPCTCRKPEPGLIEKACQDLGIDRRDSWMVGDSSSDIEAGRRAGVRTILLRTGYAGSDAKHAVQADYICPDLQDAAKWILEDHADLSRRMAPIATRACDNTRLVLLGGLARAGKSFAAQVLKELLHALGRKAHVVSLDGWLKPLDQRLEGGGVCTRYDLVTAAKVIDDVTQSTTRVMLKEPLYNRATRVAGGQTLEQSVGPNDILIVEGVPALLMKETVALPKTLKIYLETAFKTRDKRLSQDYLWRNGEGVNFANALASRELDETPVVVASRATADFLIEL